VLIEAIGYGVPCVATDTGGTAEIVPDGICGRLVPRRDHNALAKRTVELVRDVESRKAFARNGRLHFERCFTAARCADATAAFFDEVIKAHGRRQS
jgi:D-inositol-3-phosphate glycosyltransferase